MYWMCPKILNSTRWISGCNANSYRQFFFAQMAIINHCKGFELNTLSNWNKSLIVDELRCRLCRPPNTVCAIEDREGSETSSHSIIFIDWMQITELDPIGYLRTFYLRATATWESAWFKMLSVERFFFSFEVPKFPSDVLFSFVYVIK